MKKILALLSSVALFATVARAQVPTEAPQSIALWTNGATASAAQLLTNVVIDCRKQASVGVQLSGYGDQAGTGNIITYFQRSVDGITYESALTPVGFALAGNTQVCIVTNLPSNGASFFKMAYYTNANGTANLTNFVAKYNVKISAP